MAGPQHYKSYCWLFMMEHSSRRKCNSNRFYFTIINFSYVLMGLELAVELTQAHVYVCNFNLHLFK
jgi:hypothetical protein